MDERGSRDMASEYINHLSLHCCKLGAVVLIVNSLVVRAGDSRACGRRAADCQQSQSRGLKLQNVSFDHPESLWKALCSCGSSRHLPPGQSTRQGEAGADTSAHCAPPISHEQASCCRRDGCFWQVSI